MESRVIDASLTEVAVERSELELVWPADLFAREAQALIDAGLTSDQGLGYLLDEAFHGGRGFQLFNQVTAADPLRFSDDPWGAPGPPTKPGAPPRAAVQLVLDLVRDVDELPRYVRRRYYSERRDSQPERTLTLPEAKAGYAAAVARLAQVGYFEEAFGSHCIDSRDDAYGEGQRQLSKELKTDRPMWPLERHGEPTRLEEDWPEGLFLDVVEALHDLVARPRWRSWHSFGEEWDYSDYARAPGRAVYRWKVNELLARSEMPLRLADRGSDQGHLVHATGDPRDDLVARALITPDLDVRTEVEHAIALFRSRSGTREDKRSAVVALARVLEDRRNLLHKELGKKDEGALFHIANQFDLRHRRGDQRGDYAGAYLDWIFWWYLATVELTDRLLARQASSR